MLRITGMCHRHCWVVYFCPRRVRVSSFVSEGRSPLRRLKFVDMCSAEMPCSAREGGSRDATRRGSPSSAQVARLAQRWSQNRKLTITPHQCTNWCAKLEWKSRTHLPYEGTTNIAPTNGVCLYLGRTGSSHRIKGLLSYPRKKPTGIDAW